MKIISGIIFCLSLLTNTAFLPMADNRKLIADKKTSTVTYAMSHPAHNWEGISKDVNAILVYDDASKSITQVAVSLKIDSFDSGNANRDSHAIEVLEGLKFPKVTFSSNKISGSSNSLSAEGNLSFHGVTKPVVITVERKDSSKGIELNGKFDILLSDYNIERPSLFGIKTKDEVKLSFRVVFPL